jgi:hypothetical protein
MGVATGATAYRFFGTTGWGSSPWNGLTLAYWMPAPPAPTAASGTQSATVTVSAPSSGPTPTSYTVTAYSGATPRGTCTVTGASGSCDVTGLTAGTSYTFKATVTDGYATSAASAASDAVTPDLPAAPDTPTAPSATAGDTQATVTVTANSGGTAVTKYIVTAYDANVATAHTCEVDSSASPLTCDVTGLTNATAYTFKAVAHNAGGDSASSSASNSVTPTAPAATPAPSPTPEPASGGTSSAQPPATPLSAAPATGSSTLGTPPPLVMRAPAQRNGQIITTGQVPDEATSVVQVAHTGAGALSRGLSIWAHARVITKCPITGQGSARVFTCSTRLGAGTWVLTTQARKGSTVVASTSRRVAVKATTRAAVTG